jgi:hypothetical protein
LIVVLPIAVQTTTVPIASQRNVTGQLFSLLFLFLVLMTQFSSDVVNKGLRAYADLSQYSVGGL